MQPLTLQEVQQAFIQKKRKRFLLVYLYFESHFHAGLPADLVAQKLSEVLAIPITRNQVFEIHRRYRSKKTGIAASTPVGPKLKTTNLETTNPGTALLPGGMTPDGVTPGSSVHPSPMPDSRQQASTSQLSFINADDQARINPFAQLLKDL